MHHCDSGEMAKNEALVLQLSLGAVGATAVSVDDVSRSSCCRFLPLALRSSKPQKYVSGVL